MRTQIKICGIQSTSDAQAAVSAGADALGFVFYPPSKRNITPEAARSIVETIGPFITSVGLFVNPTVEFVTRVLQLVPLQVLQFHGAESPQFCRQFGRPYIKAFAASDDEELLAMQKRYHDAIGWLVDAPSECMPGGNGKLFDWSTLSEQAYSRLVLAGGLNKDNVAAAVLKLKPLAVDVSSGVEDRDGRKDGALLKAFCTAVKEIDMQVGSVE